MFCSYTVCYFRYIVTESTVAEKNRAPILRLLRSAIVSDFFKKEKKNGGPAPVWRTHSSIIRLFVLS